MRQTVYSPLTFIYLETYIIFGDEKMKIGEMSLDIGGGPVRLTNVELTVEELREIVETINKLIAAQMAARASLYHPVAPPTATRIE